MSNATTFALIADYQYRENYGAHDWDGVGECPQYWKNKGGHEVVVAASLSIAEVTALGAEGLEKLVGETELGFGKYDEYCEYVCPRWELVELNDELVDGVREYLATHLDDQFGDDPQWVAVDYGIPEFAVKWAMSQIASEEDGSEPTDAEYDDLEEDLVDTYLR